MGWKTHSTPPDDDTTRLHEPTSHHDQAEQEKLDQNATCNDSRLPRTAGILGPGSDLLRKTLSILQFSGNITQILIVDFDASVMIRIRPNHAAIREIGRNTLIIIHIRRHDIPA